MGIYDRDYYRREGPSYLQRYSVRGQVVFWVLAVNVALFILQLLTRQRVSGPVTEALELVPRKVLSGEVWRLLTYAFIHDDGAGGSNFIWHIVFNMWMFYLFAGYVEDIYGRWEFLCFYLASAVMGGVIFTALAFTPLQRGGLDAACLGASGAVTATLVLCAWHFPNLTILFMFILPVPVWAFAAFHVAQDAFGLLRGAGEVAFSVHLAGAAVATAYYKLQFRFMGLLPNFRSWKVARSRPRFRVYRGEEDTPQPVPVGGPDTAELDEQLEAKVDAVLEKIGRSGKDSLTDAERQLLLKAGEIYKRRRS